MTVDEARVLWVRVEKPVFDLWGVIVSSLTFTLIMVGIAACLGGALGYLFIVRNRRRDAAGSGSGRLSLGLGLPSAPRTAS